ncbi:MAG: hypothetical protein ACYDBO_06205 [Vulcanimicrobiaceae bacterium]
MKRCRNDIIAFLVTITLKRLFDPRTWPQLAAFVRVIPQGDIIPSRGQYAAQTHDWQVAINRLFASSDKPEDGIWYALPDIVASVLLTGRIPTIVDAFRIVPDGMLKGLQSTKLLGDIAVAPSEDDFFRTVIEERIRLSSDPRRAQAEQQRYKQGLKVLGNATSYGIFAQMDPREADDSVHVTCYGIDPEPFSCEVKHPESPGEYCFPPLASLITSGARLVLAMLERCVTDLGGTYAMEDTDSMAIVATRRGGRIPRIGKGTHKAAGMQALSWAQVQGIAERFAALNPYDRGIIPGSVLKIEPDNFDPKTGRQRQLWCYAIATKRYAFFTMNRAGEPELRRKGVNAEEDRWSEHGLGHLLNPTDPDSDDRDWIAQAWLRMIRHALGLPTKAFAFEKRPAMTRQSITSPAVLEPFAALNAGKPYVEQVKPFNFMLTCHVRSLGHPIGTDPERFHLVAPYEVDARKWEALPWIDKYSGKRYRITTQGEHGTRGAARVKTYGDVLREYAYHPEAKCAGADGQPCSKQTVGLLQRRHVRIDGLRCIGKESNKLEEVEAGAVHDADEAYVEYPDARRERETWLREVVPKLKAMSLKELQSRTGLSLAAIKAVRAGRMPHARNRARIVAALSNATKPG